MPKIIQVTDTHICRPGEAILGLDPAERLRMVVRSINRNHGDAALCVVTGDLTDQGEVEAYSTLKTCLSELRVPYRLMLGNHDARAPFLEIFPDVGVDRGGFVQGVAEVGDAACIYLDTLDEEEPSQGVLCARRLAWLEEQLKRFAERRTVVFMHHPPHSIGLRWFESMLLANGEEVMTRLSRHGRVMHIVFGHVHVNTSGVWRGISFSASRGTCHKVLSDPESESADYVDQGPAYDVLLLGQDGVCVHSIDPAGPNGLIAREHPTPDGRGTFELVGPAGAQRWM